MYTHIAAGIIALYLVSTTASAQLSENTPLHTNILKLDYALFEEGFNQCKLDVLDKYISTKLEFFHDLGGIQSQEQFMAGMNKNICSNPNHKPIRTLVRGSTQVFPLENNGTLYGAIHQGQHRFHIEGSDTEQTGCTVAKFTNVWLLQNEKWQLKSALSFDHQHTMQCDILSANIKLNRSYKEIIRLSLAKLIFSVKYLTDDKESY